MGITYNTCVSLYIIIIYKMKNVLQQLVPILPIMHNHNFNCSCILCPGTKLIYTNPPPCIISIVISCYGDHNICWRYWRRRCDGCFIWAYHYSWRNHFWNRFWSRWSWLFIEKCILKIGHFQELDFLAIV